MLRQLDHTSDVFDCALPSTHVPQEILVKRPFNEHVLAVILCRTLANGDAKTVLRDAIVCVLLGKVDGRTFKLHTKVALKQHIFPMVSIAVCQDLNYRWVT